MSERAPVRRRRKADAPAVAGVRVAMSEQQKEDATAPSKTTAAKPRKRKARFVF